MKINSVRVLRRVVTGKYEHIEVDVECTEIQTNDLESIIKEIDNRIMDYIEGVKPNA